MFIGYASIGQWVFKIIQAYQATRVAIPQCIQGAGSSIECSRITHTHRYCKYNTGPGCFIQEWGE